MAKNVLNEHHLKSIIGSTPTSVPTICDPIVYLAYRSQAAAQESALGRKLTDVPLEATVLPGRLTPE